MRTNHPFAISKWGQYNFSLAEDFPSSGHLESQGRHLRLVPGMQVNAVIHLGTRSVLEYLLPPVHKAAHEAGRER